MSATLPHVILVGGFLGAGKTTLVAELARLLIGRKRSVGIVTNDQSDDLVDTALLKYQGLNADEVGGGCFCCRFDDFIARLRELRLRQADIIIGEPVGSCADLAATVIRPLQRLYVNLFRTAPYVVVVDPIRWRECAAPARSELAERALYIYRLQIAEADAIALGKCDLISAGEREAIVAELKAAFPGRAIFAVSALDGSGVEALLQHILSGALAGREHIDVDYEQYAAGEAELGWFNASIELSALAERDWADFCRRLLIRIREQLAAQGGQIAHAKLLLAAGEYFVAANVTDRSGEPMIRGAIPRLTSEMAITLNVRAIADPEQIRTIVAEALHDLIGTTGRYRVVHEAAFRPGRPMPVHRDSLG